MTDRSYKDQCGDHGGTNRDGEPCGLAAGWGTPNDSGRCKFCLGTSPDGSSHEGNDWAVKHGAWSDRFVSDFLREDEIERVRQAEDLLGEPESAQDLARTVAAITLEQYRRSGDERFLRRFESISEKFRIAPDEKIEVTAEVDYSVSSETKEYLDKMFDRDIQQ